MAKKLSVVVISLTPFDAEGRLDESALRQHLGRLRAAGVSVYAAGSGSSEGYSLTREERDRVLQIAVEELKGKVPVRAMGCEPRLIEDMVEFVQAAERIGVDAAQIFSLEIGHGAKPTAVEMDKYYSTVIDSTSLPVYLSSHRASGYFLPLDLVERLVKRFSNIAGIAYGGSDITYLAELIERVGDRIEVHCAGPGNALAVLGLGGNGFMGGEGNLSPEIAAAVISGFRERDMERVRDAWSKLLKVAAIADRYGGNASSMRAMKPLLNAFGLPGGTLRSPRIAISGRDLEDAINAIVQLKLPGLPAAPVAQGAR